jgi:hypothetical protein
MSLISKISGGIPEILLHSSITRSGGRVFGERGMRMGGREQRGGKLTMEGAPAAVDEDKGKILERGESFSLYNCSIPIDSFVFQTMGFLL